MKKIFGLIALALVVFPAIASAQLDGIGAFILRAGFIIDAITVLVAGIALLVFFWGLVKFINTTSSEGKAEGKNFMLWGVIALFVMVSVWGLVRFIQGELLPGEDFSNITIPTFTR